MVIKASAAREIDRLIRDLHSDIVPREAAVGRLAVIGTRAVDRLLDVVSSSADTPVRAAALRALEAVGDARALESASSLMDDPDEQLAVAAAGVVRSQLRSPDAAVAAAALDRLAAVAADHGRPAAVRTASIEALKSVGSPIVDAALSRMASDAGGAPAPRSSDPLSVLQRASGGDIDDPGEIKAALAAAGGASPLPVLHKLVEVLRSRETAETATKRRADWATARAGVHQALAAQGSRVALYDLRESLSSAEGPLPIGFLAALAAVGDASCLEPLADAYARASGTRRDWWRRQVARTFADIMHRERVTARHRVMKRIAARHAAIMGELISGTDRLQA